LNRTLSYINFNRKIAAVVVLYYPGREVISKIDSYFNSIDRLYLIDNSDESDTCLYSLIKKSFFEKVSILSNHGNMGIAKALNQAAEMALLDGFNWLLMMDQDSEFYPGSILRLIRCLENYPDTAKIGIFAGNIEVQNAKNRLSSEGISSPLTVLTSGSILNLSAYILAGPFLNEFFIDQVDHEYCLRLRTKKFSILRCNAATLMHHLGNTDRHKFFGRLINVSNHDHIRRYYMTRNRFEVCRRYFFIFPYYSFSLLWFSFVDLILIFLYEKEKKLKIRSVLLGLKDFLKGKFGRYSY